MKQLLSTAAAAAALAIGAASCVSAKRPVMPSGPVPPEASLWREPSDLAARDLFYGPWGAANAPDPDDTYTLVGLKHSGVNLGLTVRDSRDREWSVKQPYPGDMDSEAPVEVTLSRLLSAVGYHQPPVYHLRQFRLKDDWGTHMEAGGRFRLKHEDLDEEDPWRWEDNPFVGSRPYQGLLALLMLFNSTDIKNSNNSIYEYTSGGRVELWYAVRDIGSALGDTDRFAPRKNHAPSFERTPFILGLTSRGNVDFAYTGWYENYVSDRIAPEDVVWAATLLSRLTDRQWADAFRAGGYEPAVAERFIRALRAKIAEARSLKPAASD
ncbi:MAG TPA: hypothetical protein VFZ36_00220 [Vicinamibacterales bacterium]